MKNIKTLIAFGLVLCNLATFAQKTEVNTKKSSVEWLGKKIGGEHHGYIQLKSGYFDLQDGKIAAGNFVIDMTTITNTDVTDAGSNQKLVNHLQSEDFFGVEKYPIAKFTVINSTNFKNGKATVSGNITIKGKTESISFEVVQSGNEYTAKIDIDRSKFDVKYGSNSFFDNLGNKTIDDIFTLTIKLAII